MAVKKADKTAKAPQNKIYTPAVMPALGNSSLMNSAGAMPPMPGMIPGGMPMPTALPQIDFNALKDKLEGLKKEVLKKYSFTMGICILPAIASQIMDEEDNVPKEVSDTKPIHMLMIVPEENYKEIPKIKPEVVELIKVTQENIWLHIWTPVDLWNFGLDSKFDVLDAVSASFPIHDAGFLGALRVANIHKTLVLRKFDKYVSSYVIGGSLVRGTAGKDSDVDTFVIIDDTDVKRMPRLELLERLRGMIYEYIREATALAGVTNILNVQVYLMTDFWQSVKDAQPVHFTFIRDGVPLYDRGTFTPWKRLLQMGKIKPSPEAVDMFVKQGEQTDDFVKRRLLDSMVDVYWGVVTPTQAMMMLAGEAPPVPKTIVADVKKALIEKEKAMTLTDLKTLEKVVKLYKDYEHGTLKEISGKEIDELLKEAKEYGTKLKEVRKVLEKNAQKRTSEEIYKEVFGLLKMIFGQKTQEEYVKEFEQKLVKKGKIQARFSKVMHELLANKQKISQGKLDQKEVDKIKRDAYELVGALVEYAQRADLVQKEKSVMQISYQNRKAELVLLGKNNFLVEQGAIKRITSDKLVETSKEEFEKSLEENKGKITTQISGEVFSTLHKLLGSFEMSI